MSRHRRGPAGLVDGEEDRSDGNLETKTGFEIFGSSVGVELAVSIFGCQVDCDGFYPMANFLLDLDTLARR